MDWLVPLVAFVASLLTFFSGFGLGTLLMAAMVCYFSPDATAFKIPKEAIASLGNGPNSNTSEEGLIHVDFIHSQYLRDQHEYVRQLYIESYTRHTHGTEYFGSTPINFGKLIINKLP